MNLLGGGGGEGVEGWCFYKKCNNTGRIAVIAVGELFIISFLYMYE